MRIDAKQTILTLRMRLILIIVAILVLGYVIYTGTTFYLKIQISKKIISTAAPFQKVSTDISVPILVLGDSTAVGVGASTPEESVAGRISKYLAARSVENYAKSGAVVADLSEQITHAKLAHYRLIFIQIGANDIIRFHSASTAAMTLAAALKQLPPADRVLLISLGDGGGTTLFPFFLNPFYTNLTLQYNAAFTRVASAADVSFVNLYNSPSTKMIKDNPKLYLAGDGLHPSSAGYELWFETIKGEL